MFRKLLQQLDRAVDNISNEIARTRAPFEDTRIRLNVRLTLVLFICALIYAFSFLPDEYYLPAVVTFAASFGLLLIPFVTFATKHRTAYYTVFLLATVATTMVNVFGSGQGVSMSMILWQIFMVHLGFVILTRRVAVVFGVAAVGMFLLKDQLLRLGHTFPYIVNEELVARPRIVDIVIPAFFNFYLAYTSHRIFIEVRHGAIQAGKNLQELGKQFRQTESRYEFILDQGLGFFVISTLSGKILFANNALSQKLGYSHKEILNLRIPDLLHGSVRDGYATHVDSLVRNGHESGIIKVQSRTGTTYYWNYRNMAIPDANSELQIIGFAQDVTELIHARKRIRYHEQELEALISSLNDIVMLIDEEDVLIKCWSHISALPSPETCTGKKMEVVLATLFGSDERVLHAYQYARHAQQQLELTAQTRHTTFNAWFDVRISPISQNGKNMMSILLRDVTAVHEKNLAEKAAEAKGNEYRSAITQLSLSDLTAGDDPLETLATICQTTSKTMQVQRASLWLFTDNRESIENRVTVKEESVSKFSKGEGHLIKVVDFPHYFRELEKGRPIAAADAHSDKATYEFKESLLPNGIISMLDIPLLLHSELIGVICFEQKHEMRQWDEKDIELGTAVATLCTLAMEGHRRKMVQSELQQRTKKLEESYAEVQLLAQHLADARAKAEESDRLKSLFLANISHEIRTPMNAISGFSELLDRPHLDEQKRREFSRLIRERSIDLLGIINNVLDMSGIEGGHVSLIEVEGNIGELLDRIVTSVKAENRYLRGKDITFRKTNRLTAAEQVVRLDFTRVYQVLYNLMTNAVKFTNSGYIDVEVHKQSANVLQFSVRDTGIGISADKLDYLFKPFRQADESIFKKFGGSGLGLAICKGLVELMGGKIWVESTEGQGTTFHFSISLEKNNAEDKNELVGARILVVDEHAARTKAIMETLLSVGAHAQFALSCTEAINIAKNGVYNIVLIDAQIPSSCAAQLLVRMESHGKARVLLMNTTAPEADATRRFTEPLYVTNPLNRGELIVKIKTALRQIYLHGNNSMPKAESN